MATPPQDDDPPPLPAHLRTLRTLVTVLTAVMILGVITIVALLVIRLSADPRPVLVTPEVFDLPPGLEVTGYSLAGDLAIVVGADNVIRVFDTRSGALIREVDLTR